VKEEREMKLHHGQIFYKTDPNSKYEVVNEDIIPGLNQPTLSFDQ
jgi:hypothetical protein